MGKQWTASIYKPKKKLFVKNNNLFIRGIKEKHGVAQYTSGRINTSKKFNWKYGRFEVRAKISKQKGVWPAVWLLSENIEIDGWPKCGEIDIMEHINNEDVIYGTIHSEKYNHIKKNQIGGKTIVDEISSIFHTYGLEWNSESILWFVDNKIYFSLDKKDYFKKTWPFDNEYFLIINQAIGGFWPGEPEVNFKTSDYIIDWIKIYQ